MNYLHAICIQVIKLICLIGQMRSGLGYVPELGPIPIIMTCTPQCQGPNVPCDLPPGRLRPLPPHHVALRGPGADAALLIQEENIHGPHPKRPERLRQRHPAGHHQPQTGPAAPSGEF